MNRALEFGHFADRLPQPAPMGMAIKVVTTIVIGLNAAFFIGAIAQRAMLLPAAILSAAVLACYLFWSPVSCDWQAMN